MDAPLMHVVCGGDLAELKESDRERCEKVSAWWEWRDGQLWTAKGRWRRVPPIVKRARLTRAAAESLGFPSGATLAPLLAQRYYWHGLARDCVVLCARWLPV